MLRASNRPAKCLVLAAALAGAACGSEAEPTVTLEFPARAYFLASHQAEILAFRQSGSTRCAELASAAARGSLGDAPDGTTGLQPVCSFVDGGETISKLTHGKYDFVATARDGAFVLLAGCTEGKVGDGGDDVIVSLGIVTSAGERAVSELESSCEGIEDRCAGTCR